MVRICDVVFSFIGLLLLSPFLIIVYILIVCESPGGGFYRQSRVGKNGRDFKLWKFRSMRVGSDKKGLITVGGHDSRITRVGYFIRKYKIDELPQLINVLIGDMSIVGPRPEVRKYVDMYTYKQRKVLCVLPGITDLASIEYVDENEVLGKSENPDKTYVEEIMPKKIDLNMRWINNTSLNEYFHIIFRTFYSIFA